MNKASSAEAYNINSSVNADKRHLSVIIDPDNILNETDRSQFKQLHEEFSDVFEPIRDGYNGKFGECKAYINMGPTQPPQRSGRLPLYSAKDLNLFQAKCDELEEIGVLADPEKLGIYIEYLNFSFLVSKPDGSHRFVTDFGDVGRYSKPRPSCLTSCDESLRKIAIWKLIIKSDLLKAYFQQHMHRDSMKYTGIVTPFKGVRCYARGVMGAPGMEGSLDELLCKVLGDLVQEGIVIRQADDLFIGGNTIPELLGNWRRVLSRLSEANLKLSPSKTIVCPKSVMILGWIWNEGSLTASPHRQNTLATCDKPTTTKALKSWLGAYKTLARVIPNCSQLLSPLEEILVSLKQEELASTRISWTSELSLAWDNAQKALSSPSSIVMPRPSDSLWIVTDGARVSPGIGATLYVVRNGKTLVSEFFSAKLPTHQARWLPCEIEALAIAAAVRHFSPYIIQSKHTTNILTDSKPCVQAAQKMSRGEFSASPRITTFQSMVNRFQCTVSHLSGSNNPLADFASRNALPCLEPKCTVCVWNREQEHSAVFSSGNVSIPYTSRNAWLSTQSECADLRRVKAHLHQGTRPSKKLTNVKDVKRYLQVCTIARDGLLVVRVTQPLRGTTEAIVVPRSVAPGLVTALHLKLDHPSAHQLKLVLKRHFFILDVDNFVEECTDSCHQCVALAPNKKLLEEQSTSTPPPGIGFAFAVDVLQRERQRILVLRETVTSFTMACLLPDEKATSMRDPILRMVLLIHPVEGPPAVVRSDNFSSFKNLVKDPLLKEKGIQLDLGRAVNKNKNPVAERAIRELEDELLRMDPSGAAASSWTLYLATASLNQRIRWSGLSAREMLFRRDQFTNDPIETSDSALIEAQLKRRNDSHHPSARSKAAHADRPQEEEIKAGDIVYLRHGKSKHHPRDRFLVTGEDAFGFTEIRKFAGNQLREAAYKVKPSELVKTRQQPTQTRPGPTQTDPDPDTDDSDVDIPAEILPPTPTPEETPPDIPEDPAVRAPTPEPAPAPEPPPVPEPNPAPETTGAEAPLRRSSRQKRSTQKPDFSYA